MLSIRKAQWTCLLLLVLLVIPISLSAGMRSESQDGVGLEALKDPASGWRPVTKGVWTRPTPDGRTETYVEGREGLTYVLPALRTHLAELVDAYLARPDSERYVALEEYSRFIEKVEKAAAGKGSSPDQGSLAKTSCQYSFGYGADAFPSHCTNQAQANASYSAVSSGERCGKCDVYAYAYVERTCGGTTNTQSQSCSDHGTNVSCSASASLGTSASSCYGYAFASIYCPDLNNLYLSTSDTDTACGVVGSCSFCFQSVEEEKP